MASGSQGPRGGVPVNRNAKSRNAKPRTRGKRRQKKRTPKPSAGFCLACGSMRGLPAMIGLQTATGISYVDLARIEAISAPFSQSNREVRQITSWGSAKISVLTTADNYKKLAPVLPAEAQIAAAKAPAKPPAKPETTESKPDTTEKADADDV